MGHPFTPKASFDGGDLDCGNGLLLLIRRHIDPLAPGELLEIRSRELSVDEELPEIDDVATSKKADELDTDDE